MRQLSADSPFLIGKAAPGTAAETTAALLRLRAPPAAAAAHGRVRRRHHGGQRTRRGSDRVPLLPLGGPEVEILNQ